MLTITRRFEFDAAHRVLGHEGKCRHLHGHHYVADVTIQGVKQLDSLGMVADFGVLKQHVGGWIDEMWDHNILLNANDPLAILYHNMGDKRIGVGDAEGRRLMGFVGPIFQGKPPYILGKINAGRNPTAEEMVTELAVNAQLLLNQLKLLVVKVRLYETPNCWADWVIDVEQFQFEPLQVQVKQKRLADGSDLFIEDDE